MIGAENGVGCDEGPALLSLKPACKQGPSRKSKGCRMEWGGKWEGPMGAPVSITGANLTGHLLAGSWGDFTPAVLCIASEPGDAGLISDGHLSTLTRLCC